MSTQVTEMEADSQISALIVNASDGTLTESEVRDETTTLLEKGFGSLSFLKLIDSIELSYGVYIDLEEDTAFLGRVSGIRSFLIAEGVLELA